MTHSLPAVCPSDDWTATEYRSSDPREIGPGDFIWANVSVEHTIEKTSKRRHKYDPNITPYEAIRNGPTACAHEAESSRRPLEPRKKSSTMQSDTHDKTTSSRPVLVLFTITRDTERAYIAAPLTQFGGTTLDKSNSRDVQGFHDMVYPVSREVQFEKPAGRRGGAPKPQKRLRIRKWYKRSKHQYCLLGALVKVKTKDATQHFDSDVHRLSGDVLRQAQREAMELMNHSERERLHIEDPDFVNRVMNFDPLPPNPQPSARRQV
ncbi:hypothetical protein FRC04_011463 [Tulasnella sp. 424]|nr:hypothetical protein FRC04_011463 [Tulasnella sp. 424]